MLAAAAGKSTLGIPRAVGREYVGKDDAPIAAGVVFVAPDGDVLVLRRSSKETNFAGYWSLPGGKAEEGETAEQAAVRETIEETGNELFLECGPLKLLDRRETPTGMVFSTFAQPVVDKFVPTLNDEHSGYAWAPLSQLPLPLHPAVNDVFSQHLGAAKDLPADDWAILQHNFADWACNWSNGECGLCGGTGELVGPGIVCDDCRGSGLARAMAKDSIALDRASVRTIDDNGHLHVDRTPISKAVVNPYYGREIPDFERLGLDPERIYRLYRDPDELARAAKSFEGKPLLIQHKPVSADDHPKSLTVGTIGSPVTFNAPYLTAPLVVWDAEGISGIQNEERRELSCGYRYRPDMTPGRTPHGEPYDGVMRDLGGNHVALVEQGRAGPDVLVQDSALNPTPKENDDMAPKPVLTRKGAVAQSALMVYLRPKLAQDAKIDLTLALAGVTSKNFVDKRPSIIEGVKKATAGKLAADAKLDDIAVALDIAQDDMEPRGEDEEPEDEEDKKKPEAEDDGEEVAGAEDEDDDDDKEEKVSKSAMDEAIRTSAAAIEKKVRKQFADLRIAEDEVRPYVGKIAVACDSAEAVYRHALDAMKIDIVGLEPSAYRSLLKALPVPSATPAPVITAMDAAADSAYSTRFPDAGRLK